MRSTLRSLSVLSAVAGALVAGTALAGEVRTFERLDKAPTPGELAQAPALDIPQIDGPGFGLTPDPRETADPGQALGGALQLQVYGAGPYGVAQSARTSQLLGERSLYDYDGFDRSSSRYRYGYGYGEAFASYSPAWRDYSFAGRVSPGDIAGLPSVSAPRSFWGFRN